MWSALEQLAQLIRLRSYFRTIRLAFLLVAAAQRQLLSKTTLLISGS